MRDPREKVYCKRCGRRTLYHYCEFTSGEVLEDDLCPVCGPSKPVILTMKSGRQRAGVAERGGERM